MESQRSKYMYYHVAMCTSSSAGMVAEAESSLRHLTVCPSRFLVYRSCQSSSLSWTAQTSLTLLPRVNSAYAQIYT